MRQNSVINSSFIRVSRNVELSRVIGEGVVSLGNPDEGGVFKKTRTIDIGVSYR